MLLTSIAMTCASTALAQSHLWPLVTSRTPPPDYAGEPPAPLLETVAASGSAAALDAELVPGVFIEVGERRRIGHPLIADRMFRSDFKAASTPVGQIELTQLRDQHIGGTNASYSLSRFRLNPGDSFPVAPSCFPG